MISFFSKSDDEVGISSSIACNACASCGRRLKKRDREKQAQSKFDGKMSTAKDVPTFRRFSTQMAMKFKKIRPLRAS